MFVCYLLNSQLIRSATNVAAGHQYTQDSVARPGGSRITLIAML
jgi:hypothetical protein